MTASRGQQTAGRTRDQGFGLRHRCLKICLKGSGVRKQVSGTRNKGPGIRVPCFCSETDQGCPGDQLAALQPITVESELPQRCEVTKETKEEDLSDRGGRYHPPPQISRNFDQLDAAFSLIFLHFFSKQRAVSIL